jgi:hypothetical protein
LITKSNLKSSGISGWLELSWKMQPTEEFKGTTSKEICARCISKVVSFEE